MGLLGRSFALLHHVCVTALIFLVKISAHGQLGPNALLLGSVNSMDTGIRHSLKRSHAEDSALPCQALKVHMRAGFRSLSSGFRTHIEELPAVA